MSKEVEAQIMEVFAPLGEELARDIIAHRKGLKCPLTVRGANGLMKEYLLAGDPIQAAEYHLNMGWRGFSHSWLQKAQGKANGRRTIVDVAAEFDARYVDSWSPVGVPSLSRN